MPKFLADENFDGHVLREITRLLASFDVVRVQDVRLQGAKDEVILEWAAENDLVVLTHDVRTMTRHGRDRLAQGLLFPGMVVVKRTSAIGRIVKELEVLIACTNEDEWGNYIWFIPF